ncbi:MAG: alpha/beta hydrolase [Rickettsiales bacterium]|nr:alpha/beta hydrolase [Rickettsiales bacterium]
MSSKTFGYAAIAMRILEKLLGSNFSVSGIEKLPKRPVLFVANHFTRSETFFVPYLIYKYTGRQVRCLADSGLFHGALGRFLESTGTISTKHKNRDNVILKDLITGDYDWMIYPEGSMLKSKAIEERSGFINYTPSRVGPVRTGSAVLALKSQIYRSDIVDAFEQGKIEELKELEETFGVSYQNYFKEIDTQIVPLNITYYPLRPGKNKIQQLAARLVKRIPKQVAEELEIEGNLLLGADINVSFGDPINVGDYIKSARGVINQLPIIADETKTNMILRYFKSRLTNEFMAKIYSDIQINLDHLFSAALGNFEEEEIEIGRLKRVVYFSGVMIARCGKYRLNHSVYEENLMKIFLDEPHHDFDGVFELAKKQGIIEEVLGGKIKIKKDLLKKEYDFHEIRLENSLQVVANEFSLLDTASTIVKRSVKIDDEELRQKVFDEIYKRDLEIFESDYQIYFDEKFSKDRSVGAPFFLESRAKVSSQVRGVGVLVSHGYKAAPQEIAELAQFLNGFGFKVYGTRLKGHGTSPINLKDTTWEDWYTSMQRGYAALQNICAKIVIVGFSTGGLLGLVSCSRKNQVAKKLVGVVSINAALKLLDLKARMVPGINMWNEMLDKLHIDKGHFEYVDDVPENPHINYSRNYLKGVEQLSDLMAECEKNLAGISTNALIIQATKDPVVNPVSGKIIYDTIKSPQKFFSQLEFSNHVIVTGPEKEEVFEEIRKFFAKIKLI